ncbi:MAG TPA: hypothetical protein VFW45_13980, partial [Candidatus Polarisedimenticolia bacterium]|nr:hypothetical protein [Candidatus Polarisedimenticolia bacterium]
MDKVGWMVLSILVAAAAASHFAAPKSTTPSTESFNCKIVQCAAPDCLDNEHLQTPPGQCCP